MMKKRINNNVKCEKQHDMSQNFKLLKIIDMWKLQECHQVLYYLILLSWLYFQLSLYFFFFYLAIKNYTSVIKKPNPTSWNFSKADTSFSSVDYRAVYYLLYPLLVLFGISGVCKCQTWSPITFFKVVCIRKLFS